MRLRDDESDIDERADPDDIETEAGTECCRHPFGLHNPPVKVWEAHRRLVLGTGDSGDQELVGNFAAENAYYGKGLGQSTSMSRRLKIRRPRYSAKLAKERRIRKEMESKKEQSLEQTSREA